MSFVVESISAPDDTGLVTVTGFVNGTDNQTVTFRVSGDNDFFTINNQYFVRAGE